MAARHKEGSIGAPPSKSPRFPIAKSAGEMWLQTGAGRRGRGGYQGGWCTGAWGGVGPVLPAAVTSFICIRREVIDGKVAELKGNVYFVLCFFCFVYNT